MRRQAQHVRSAPGDGVGASRVQVHSIARLVKAEIHQICTGAAATTGRKMEQLMVTQAQQTNVISACVRIIPLARSRDTGANEGICNCRPGVHELLADWNDCCSVLTSAVGTFSLSPSRRHCPHYQRRSSLAAVWGGLPQMPAPCLPLQPPRSRQPYTAGGYWPLGSSMALPTGNDSP